MYAHGGIIFKTDQRRETQHLMPNGWTSENVKVFPAVAYAPGNQITATFETFRNSFFSYLPSLPHYRWAMYIDPQRFNVRVISFF